MTISTTCIVLKDVNDKYLHDLRLAAQRVQDNFVKPWETNTQQHHST
jgi:hypothetical protein